MVAKLRNPARFALFITAALMMVVSVHNLPAGLYHESTTTSVEVDGVNYGTFTKISELDPQKVMADIEKSGHVRVSLQRDFVTEPSLYLWARRMASQRQGQRDMHLVRRNESGDVVSRYVLKFCQPVSWTVEAANPALGGFHETVDVAVQSIEIY